MEVEQGEKSKSTIAKDIGVQFNALSTWLKKKKSLLTLINNSTQREKTQERTRFMT